MKKVVVTGGTGFIGRRLTTELLGRGDEVTVLTRDPERARADVPERARCVAWDPSKAGPWADEIAAADGVMHLAGEPVAKRWSDAVKERIVKSRVDTTRLVVEAIGAAAHKPSVLVCASATGYYGPQPPDLVLDETAPAGEGFLADVVKRWEEAARAVEGHGVRSAQVRIGVVLGEGGGALEKMILPFKLFAGGPVGAGTQVVSWVHHADVVGLLLLALDDEQVKGPVNAVSPNPATSKELADAIGKVLHRPSWLSAPAFAVEAAMGEAASILTTGQRVRPAKALDRGYAFQFAELAPALESILGRK